MTTRIVSRQPSGMRKVLGSALSSNGYTVYQIIRDAEGGVYCTCPAWKFQRVNPRMRTCKHLQRFFQSR